MLAREDLRRRHHRRLPSGLDGTRHGEQAHDGLAGADIALEEAQHALVADHVLADLADGPRLRPRQREGQGLREGLDQAPVTRIGASRLAAHARAHDGEGELGGEELVIGEPPPRRIALQRLGLRRLGVGRAVERGERLAKGREGVALHPGQILPFGELGNPLQRGIGKARDQPRGQALGLAVDGFDAGQLVGLSGIEDAIGMHHLAPPVP